MIRWIRETETNIVELMKTYHISGNQTKGQKRAIMKAKLPVAEWNSGYDDWSAGDRVMLYLFGDMPAAP